MCQAQFDDLVLRPPRANPPTGSPTPRTWAPNSTRSSTNSDQPRTGCPRRATRRSICRPRCTTAAGDRAAGHHRHRSHNRRAPPPVPARPDSTPANSPATPASSRPDHFTSTNISLYRWQFAGIDLDRDSTGPASAPSGSWAVLAGRRADAHRPDRRQPRGRSAAASGQPHLAARRGQARSLIPAPRGTTVVVGTIQRVDEITPR